MLTVLIIDSSSTVTQTVTSNQFAHLSVFIYSIPPRDMIPTRPFHLMNDAQRTLGGGFRNYLTFTLELVLFTENKITSNLNGMWLRLEL